MHRVFRFIAVLLWSIPSLPTLAQAGSGWEQVASEEGITVYSKQAPGRGFPTFRGVGLVGADIFQVMAVLSDIERYPQWADRCMEARLLEKKSEFERILYNRTDSPWPVEDRDAVFHSVAHVDLKKMVVNIRFQAVRSERMRPIAGVVRMNWLRGHYVLSFKGPGKTLVDYQVDANPGGLLPTWLAKMATRRLPLFTIRNLRTQCKKTEGWYKTRIEQWKKLHKEMEAAAAAKEALKTAPPPAPSAPAVAPAPEPKPSP